MTETTDPTSIDERTVPARAYRALRAFPLPMLAASGLALGSALLVLAHDRSTANLVWLGTVAVGGIPLVYGTVRRLLRRELSADVIAAVAVLTALALDQAFAGAVIVLMQSGGEALERYAFERTSSALDRLRRRAPRRAVRLVGGRPEEVDVGDLAVGDRLLVRAGDVLAVDGRVESGSALLDESAVTGEPLPVSRTAGASVLSGTSNVGRPFVLVALRRTEDSQYARMVQLALEARRDKPRIQRLADRYAVGFTPFALVVAVLGALYTHQLVTFLAVLVVATPCPLILATPIAVLAAINRASETGLLVKGGSAMEELGRIHAVFLDKTGTITRGRPDLERIVVDGGYVETDLLAWAASLEANSSHPLALATVREAARRQVPLRPATEVREEAGQGLSGWVDGRAVAVGSWRWVAANLAPSAGPPASPPDRSVPAGRARAYLAIDGSLAGTILYADRIRPEATRLVRRLGELGVEHVELLTGDLRANADAVAAEVGIRRVGAELTPTAKLDIVRAARSSLGSVAMVGDGINDAGALAAASVGIALGAEGAGVTTEAGDVVLLLDEVDRVADGVALGQRMLRIARRGILFGLGSSVVLMVIAATGAVVPALGAGLQEVIDVAVILNALRV